MNYILIGFLLLMGCGNVHQTGSFSSGNLLGSWQLENEPDAINYGEIKFTGDSTALFLSRGDTIYRFKFHVKSEDLYLIDVLGKMESYQIISLTDNKLIFSSLREKKGEQVYKRTE